MKQDLSLPVEVEAFDTWAEVYDTQPNPLLALEERVLGSMMPDVRGLDVLDAGCGTGRWLQRLVDRSPRSLLGVDISPAMLLLAGIKLSQKCSLRNGSCTALPVSDTSCDMVLSSFVVSYLEDLEAFAREIDRVARPGATIFLTDMHPETEAFRGWKRAFKVKGAEMQISARGWDLQQITQAFQARGFKLVSLAEPAFGPEERQIFEESGKLELYHSTEDLPAIYVLQLRKPASFPRLRKVLPQSAGAFVLKQARCAIGPDRTAAASISVVGERIESVQNLSRGQSQAQFDGRYWVDAQTHSVIRSSVDLSGYLLLPGLINSHDHLEFSLYPNIGDGPYYNAAQWARDIHANSATLIARHRKVPRSTSLWWGAIRNLLCGATTVCHHNPVAPELTASEFPIRVVSEFGWAHSPSMEPDLAGKFRESRADLPFIVHAAEGVDEGSAEEIFELDRIHALDQRTVLVHGLACTPESISLINRRCAALILCPTSNEFLFHRSPSLAFIRSLDNAVLGSDSPLTAAGDLLDEIRFAHMRIGIDANAIYAMVTNRPAEVLRLRRGEGGIKPGSIADMVVVRDTGLSPAETLAQLTSDQIELVILGGRIQLAGPSLIERLPSVLRQGLQCFEVDGQPRWVRAPIDKLLAEAEEVLGSDLRVGGKRVCRAPAA
jgi:cytosine/adenosine deaminase-related metal-dependent hydrolase/ubiquinone/menaquinone biosynthesis C-methylase UbiE